MGGTSGWVRRPWQILHKFLPSSDWLVSEEVTLLQAGRLAEAFTVSEDQIVSKYVELQESTDKLFDCLKSNLGFFVSRWSWKYAESGVFSDAEAWDTVGKEMGQTIEALRKAIRGAAPKGATSVELVPPV